MRSKDKTDLEDSLEAYRLAYDAHKDNYDQGREAKKFDNGEQWPKYAIESRGEERPCLTVNKTRAITRDIVNSLRRTRPKIDVSPIDSEADPDTAEVIRDIIDTITRNSRADLAFDIASSDQVIMGFGYMRVDLEYSHENSFDTDIVINPVRNPFSIYGDPEHQESDSSNWNRAFVRESFSEDAFKAKWPDTKTAHMYDRATFSDPDDLDPEWMDGDRIVVAEDWIREEIEKEIFLLSNRSVVEREIYEQNKELFDSLGVEIIRQRKTKSNRVKQRILTGAEILETNDWAGVYIPIIPIYGMEVYLEGDRKLYGVVHDIKDPQMMYNFWRTQSTELVALAPKAPFIGPVGAFNTDEHKWATANTRSWPYIEFDGQTAPQRQTFDGPPAGAIQEAINSADDMNAVLGIFDATQNPEADIAGSMSGRAVIARQHARDSGLDSSIFHFADNRDRAMRHLGKVLLDLIPHVWSAERIARTRGVEDNRRR